MINNSDKIDKVICIIKGIELFIDESCMFDVDENWEATQDAINEAIEILVNLKKEI